MANRSDNRKEDMAIQHTLSMNVEQRLELLANLLTEKINEDISRGGPLLKTIKETQNGQSYFSF